ncbi:hypothetical protein THOG05_410002 [Vibrio rotiferianus]|nr:hypothetical protein THOG05_410002 [Vibrio rotiferianus]CAH1581939.1 hypothetical protein THOG10_310003 [Vibrio rotiferianus]CAH1584029.1 hypothetical protein THOB06_310003 [Vibrio rotiferianus]CAH1587949.1 hypothetical protein THOE12_90051 [Vibrio rotiferianus]
MSGIAHPNKYIIPDELPPNFAALGNNMPLIYLSHLRHCT